MTEIQRLQAEGMTEMVARRHLDDRRKVIRLVAENRRRANRRAVRDIADLPPIATPVADITDVERFPEINAAIEHARTLRGEGQ